MDNVDPIIPQTDNQRGTSFVWQNMQLNKSIAKAKARVVATWFTKSRPVSIHLRTENTIYPLLQLL